MVIMATKHKRRDSNADQRLSSSSSVDKQLAHRHHDRRKNQPCCPIQVQFITFVAVYFLGSFVVILYSSMGIAMRGSEEQLSTFKFNTDWHPKTRSERFPSVEDRVKLYMSNWYLPPCSDEDKLRFTKSYNGNFTSIQVEVEGHSYDFYGVVRRDLPLYLDTATVKDCTSGFAKLMLNKLSFRQPTLIQDRSNHLPICADMEELLSATPSLATLGGGAQEAGPIPMFGPSRSIASSAQQEATDQSSCSANHPTSADLYPPIIWRLHSRRQIDMMARASRRDPSWEQKKPKAIWRVIFSGNEGHHSEKKEECMEDQLCRFVFNHANSELVDAGYGQGSANKIDGNVMMRKQVSWRSMQSNKVLIHFEGGAHDYGVGLAWKLYSRCVLLMHPPTKTTWLMEELLQPWEHFIPLNDTNAEDMVRWVIENDEEAHKISERASLFVHDLLLHPKALIDEENIKIEMIKRYQSHWLL